MTSLGGDLEVDGTVTARQATQAGQAVVLGEDMRIPTSFYEQSGPTFYSDVTASLVQNLLEEGRTFILGLDANDASMGLIQGTILCYEHEGAGPICAVDDMIISFRAEISATSFVIYDEEGNEVQSNYYNVWPVKNNIAVVVLI